MGEDIQTMSEERKAELISRLFNFGVPTIIVAVFLVYGGWFGKWIVDDWLVDYRRSIDVQREVNNYLKASAESHNTLAQKQLLAMEAILLNQKETIETRKDLINVMDLLEKRLVEK